MANSSSGGDEGVHVVDHLRRAVVAVGDRLGEELAVGVEQAVVDAPGVDADRLGVREAVEAGPDLGRRGR